MSQRLLYAYWRILVASSFTAERPSLTPLVFLAKSLVNLSNPNFKAPTLYGNDFRVNAE
jgi:hypothetical protein